MKTGESARAFSASAPPDRRCIQLPVGTIRLQAAFERTPKSRGWVIVASSGGRLSEDPLTGRMVEMLHDAGFSTLELDLLRDSEAGNQLIRFDIPRLANRLIAAVQWLHHSQQLRQEPVAFLATGNAAGAALWASAQQRIKAGAIVSLCGRPHLAEPFLGNVKCPTLLLIHADDPRLLHMNRQAEQRLNCPSKLMSLSPGKNSLQRQDRFRTLSSEAVSWISSAQGDARQPRSRWETLVGVGFTSQLKRQMLAVLAFLSVFAALPPNARTAKPAPQKPHENRDPERGKVSKKSLVGRSA